MVRDMKKLIILTLVLVGCEIHQPLEGLCYTDDRGTYLCEEPEIELEIERDLDKYRDNRDPWERCEPYLKHPEPAWINCMMVA